MNNSCRSLLLGSILLISVFPLESTSLTLKERVGKRISPITRFIKQYKKQLIGCASTMGVIIGGYYFYKHWDNLFPSMNNNAADPEKDKNTKKVPQDEVNMHTIAPVQNGVDIALFNVAGDIDQVYWLDNTRIVALGENIIPIAWDVHSQRNLGKPSTVILIDPFEDIGSVSADLSLFAQVNSSNNHYIEITRDVRGRHEVVVNAQGHTDKIKDVKFHPHEPLLISCSKNGELKIWNTHNWRCIASRVLVNHENVPLRLKSLSLNEAGDHVAVASKNGIIYVINMREILHRFAI